MSIETPLEDDYKRIAEIYNEAIKPFHTIYSEEEKEAYAESIVETAESIAELVSRRTVIILKDESDFIVGFVAFRKKNDTVVWISELYIDPKQQGKGYGTILLENVEKYAKQHGCTIVALETHRDASWAIRFYEKSGYEIVNEKISKFPYSEILEKPPIPNRPIIAKVFL